MDTDSFIVHIQSKDFYKDIAEDVEKRFDISNYEIKGPLPISINKKLIGLIKDDVSGRFMIEFVGPKPKTYFYLIDDGSDNKKVVEQKSVL